MKKILLVEDDKFLVRVYKTLLEKEGFEVGFLESGEGVLGAVKDNRPDLILLDLIMPGQDGFETLKKLRSDAEFRDIPVFVISVLGAEEDIEKTKNLGASLHIVKSDYTFKRVADLIVESFK